MECTSHRENPDRLVATVKPRSPIYARNVVATSQPLATKAGLDAMRRGGNAMDAALSAAICLTVVEPTSNGIGGDAFALIWHGGELHGFNGSGRSPQNWDMKKFDGLDRIPLRGWESVTVPGCVDAWVQCAREFGRLPFASLFESAIHYAEQGFHVGPVTARAWSHAPEIFGEFAAFSDTFLNDGRAPEVGDLVRLPHHASTLKLIAETGGDSFYRGEIAELIEADAKVHGADMNTNDLASHKGEWVKPIHSGFNGVDLHEIPPNGQGLAALVALGVLEQTPILNSELDSDDFYHWQIEAIKAGFAEAFAYVCDPRFANSNTTQELLSEENIKRHASNLRQDGVSTPQPMLEAAPSTVYLCAADQDGMMVSFIQSNFHGFGSGIVIPGTGIAIQNRAYGFTLEEGHPNEAAPDKRPFHTIIPGFVTRNGTPSMAFGVMGGHMQAQGHVQTMVRVFGFGENPQAASDAPRWQVMENGEVWLEEGFSSIVANGLADRGHHIVMEKHPSNFGGGQYILKADSGYCAASDKRKDGCAAGF